ARPAGAPRRRERDVFADRKGTRRPCLPRRLCANTTPVRPERARWRRLILIASFSACAATRAPHDAAVAWRSLPGWEEDRHAEAWPALLQSCRALAARDRCWRPACTAAAGMAIPDDKGARRFVASWFPPR